MSSSSVPLTNSQFIVDVVVRYEKRKLKCKALVDTGAVKSALTTHIVQKLSLPFLEMGTMYTANGVRESAQYEAQIDVIVGVKTVKNNCSISEIDMEDTGFNVILGIDVLQNINFCYHKNKKVLVLKA